MQIPADCRRPSSDLSPTSPLPLSSRHLRHIFLLVSRPFGSTGVREVPCGTPWGMMRGRATLRLASRHCHTQGGARAQTTTAHALRVLVRLWLLRLQQPLRRPPASGIQLKARRASSPARSRGAGVAAPHRKATTHAQKSTQADTGKVSRGGAGGRAPGRARVPSPAASPTHNSAASTGARRGPPAAAGSAPSRSWCARCCRRFVRTALRLLATAAPVAHGPPSAPALGPCTCHEPPAQPCQAH